MSRNKKFKKENFNLVINLLLIFRISLILINCDYFKHFGDKNNLGSSFFLILIIKI